MGNRWALKEVCVKGVVDLFNYLHNSLAPR